MTIIPPIGTLTVKEWDNIGPVSCSADCNPPCVITWRYKDKYGNVHDASSNRETLIKQSVNRSILLFTCTANYSGNFITDAHLNLNVQCKYFLM